MTTTRPAPAPTAHASDLELFVASAQRVVEYLRARSPLTDWSVSRVGDGAQVHLHVSGDALLSVGARVPWEETFCRRMVGGAARIVPDSQRDPDYADLEASAWARAYAGVPILDDDGSLFGTLCGVGGEPLAEGADVDRHLLEVFSDLLSAELSLVRTCAASQESARLAEALASTDRLTGVMNRHGWDLVVAEAQERRDALGDPAAVLVVDLDGLKEVNDTRGHQAGDVLISSAAAALRGAARADDRIARYGGDEFALYVEGVTAPDLPGVVRRFSNALEAARVSASVGGAAVGADGVEAALAEADAAMYAAKARRRADGDRTSVPR